MNELFNDLISTGITTIVGSSTITNTSNIAGNAIEANSKHGILHTIAKTLQSVGIAFLGMWATFHITDCFNCRWNSIHVAILPITAGTILMAPALTHLFKMINPKNKAGIEKFEHLHWTALKVVNLFTATLALAAGIYLGYSIGVIALSAVSLISSAYTLQKNRPNIA